MSDLLISSDSYEYEPIPEHPPAEPHIRLLELHGNGILTSPDHVLEGTLKYHVLDSSHEILPPYIALSYTWDAPYEEYAKSLESYHIHINRRKLAINANLYDGLVELRRRVKDPLSSSLYLWIDSVSINQSNYVEKGFQVNMMGKIYHRASKVIVWLGKVEQEEIIIVKSMVIKLAQLSRDVDKSTNLENDDKKTYFGHWQSLSEQDRSARMESIGLPPRYNSQWRLLWRFFKRRWFQRVWTIQEVVLANEVNYLCGEVEMSASDLADCVDMLYWEIRNWPEVMDGPNDYEHIIAIRNVFVIKDIQTGQGRFTYPDRVCLTGPDYDPRSAWALLLRLLYSSRRHQATISSDKVFALLGLVRTQNQISIKSLEGLIRPNYDKPTKDIFLETSKGIISDSAWLGLLTIVENRLEVNIKDIPTFVPDYTARPDQFGIGWQVFSHVLPVLEKLSSGAPRSGLPCFKGDFLDVFGLRIGTVEAISEPFIDLNDSKTQFDLGAAIISGRDMYSYTDESTLNAVWRTFLQGDKRVTSRTDLLWSYSCYCLYHIIQYRATQVPSCKDSICDNSLLRILQEYDLKTQPLTRPLLQYYISQCDSKISESTIAEIREHALPFETMFKVHYIDRCLFRTEQGYIGTCFSSVKKGDVVWLLPRSPCPFVLRKSLLPAPNVIYSFIGWAYLHGLVDGTVSEDLGSFWENILIS